MRSLYLIIFLFSNKICHCQISYLDKYSKLDFDSIFSRKNDFGNTRLEYKNWSRVFEKENINQTRVKYYDSRKIISSLIFTYSNDSIANRIFWNALKNSFDENEDQISFHEITNFFSFLMAREDSCIYIQKVPNYFFYNSERKFKTIAKDFFERFKNSEVAYKISTGGVVFFFDGDKIFKMYLTQIGKETLSNGIFMYDNLFKTKCSFVFPPKEKDSLESFSKIIKSMRIR